MDKDNKNRNPKVFISYSHKDREYENSILSFAKKLREDGIDANVDLYEEAPDEGWPLWTERQIENSDYVLIVNDKTYFEKVNGIDKYGKGVMWEVTVVYQHIYDAKMINNKFIPVFFAKEDEQYVLTPLRPFTFYNIGDEEGYRKLYARLIGVKINEKPPLGIIKSLPQKEQKTIFCVTPINIKLWDEAKWNGAMYLVYEDAPPVLALTFKNYDSAIEIFKEWKNKSLRGYINDFVNITIVERPFPKDCWVNSEKDRNYGKGYFVHIGSNIKKALELVNEKNDEDKLVITFSRYQWMNELEGTYYRDEFVKAANKFKKYFIVPAHIIDETKAVKDFDNLQIDFDHALGMKDIYIKQGTDLTKEDLCNVVLDNPN